MTATTTTAAATTVRDGVLNVRKEQGWTSHDVVARLRRAWRGMKIGHAGTLDPDAVGVLPVLIGRGTRIAEYLLDWDKAYTARLRLGIATDTQDATGTILQEHSTDGVTEEQIRTVATQFVGTIQQLPPMYSAVKVGGVPLYKAARAGRDVARQPREVTIARLDVVQVQMPDVVLHVVCSKGTYIRTLCDDLGRTLGVGGHMASLVRERVGPLVIEQALTVDEVESRLERDGLGAALLSVDDALTAFPACVVGDAVARRVMHGMPVAWSDVLRWIDGEPQGAALAGAPVRIKDGDGRLLAIGTLSTVEGSGPARRGPMAIAKMLVTDDSQSGRTANSLEE